MPKPPSFAERNLSKMDQNRARELEKVSKELEETKELFIQTQKKMKAAIARRDTLEN